MITSVPQSIGASRRAIPHLEPESFLSALAGSSNDAIIGKTSDGLVVFWNEAAERLYGYRADEMMGRQISVLFPSDRPRELASLLDRVNGGETIQNYRTERVRKDGSTVAVSITVAPVTSCDGALLGIATIAHDLTRQVRQVDDLREMHRHAEELRITLETLHASAPIGLGFLDREFRIVHLNKVLASFQHASSEDMIGTTVAESLPEIWAQVEPVCRQVIERNESVHNVEVTGPDPANPGRQRHWLASYFPVQLEDEVLGIGLMVIDVTERRQADEFRSIVMNNMAEGLLTVDNEGRLTSLNQAAVRLLGWNEEELVGEEMRDLILVTDSDESAIEAGNAMLLRVRSEGLHVQLDDHVYRRKDGGRIAVSISASPLFIGSSVEGAVVVFNDISEAKAERLRARQELDALTWVGRIREALDEDRLVLYSQPIVPLRGGRDSEELLIRMISRGGELIPPGAFLGVAEKYGLITEIDRWVVRQAVALAAGGRRVAANLSAESLLTPELADLLEAELRRSAADPTNLTFEVTETSLIKDLEKAHAVARRITGLGCSLALDDFGTGFGTFTHVKELDVRYLKIDIEFIRGLVGNRANQHVVKAIVNLASGFDCETIAEGVEDDETLRLVRELGVDYAQGFLLGRPAPLSSAPARARC